MVFHFVLSPQECKLVIKGQMLALITALNSGQCKAALSKGKCRREAPSMVSFPHLEQPGVQGDTFGMMQIAPPCIANLLGGWSKGL